MPTIYKKPKKVPAKRIYSSKLRNKEDLNTIAVYNTNIWRDLRLAYIMENPLCEICKSQGKVVSAREVHHKIHLSKGRTRFEKEQIGFDWNNLQSLCKECHKLEHLKATF